MQFTEHGGQCCGIRHLYGLRNRPEESGFAAFKGRELEGYRRGDNRTSLQCLDALLAEFERRENPEPESRLIEIVLNQNQMGPWRTRIEERGFFLVSSFHNSNTGNTCYVFHKYRDRRRYRFRDEQQAPQAAQAVEVARFYHCRYRDGRVGAGYESAEAARQANPRARISRIQVINSDGTRNWIDE